MIHSLILAGTVMGILGLVCAGVLFIAAKAFYTYEDPRIDEVASLLAGSNCGGCGFPGCRAYAEALIKREAKTSCPSTSATNMSEISKLLGISIEQGEANVAVVHCKGDASVAKYLGEYFGVEDCRAAHILGTVEKMCPYGCIGLGACIASCPYDAIRKKGTIVEVIREKCVGCGKCAAVCPRKIISLEPKSKDVVIACNSHDKGVLVKDYCQVGCIFCKKCIKTCQFDAISENDNLVKIESAKCTACGECVKACPQSTIDALIKNLDRSNRVSKKELVSSEVKG